MAGVRTGHVSACMTALLPAQFSTQLLTPALSPTLYASLRWFGVRQIPTKIEAFVGFAGPADADPAAAVSSLRRLGYLSFDSNERSNHQARELKSVHVSVEAQLVRLLIHRCHVNKLNIYNQVSRWYQGAAKRDGVVSACTVLPCRQALRAIT